MQTKQTKKHSKWTIGRTIWTPPPRGTIWNPPGGDQPSLVWNGLKCPTVATTAKIGAFFEDLTVVVVTGLQQRPALDGPRMFPDFRPTVCCWCSAVAGNPPPHFVIAQIGMGLPLDASQEWMHELDEFTSESYWGEIPTAGYVSAFLPPPPSIVNTPVYYSFGQGPGRFVVWGSWVPVFFCIFGSFFCKINALFLCIFSPNFIDFVGFQMFLVVSSCFLFFSHRCRGGLNSFRPSKNRKWRNNHKGNTKNSIVDLFLEWDFVSLPRQ